jgi:hypothetical protein
VADQRLVEALKRRAEEDRRRHQALVRALKENPSIPLRRAAAEVGLSAAYSAGEAAAAEEELRGGDRQEQREAVRRASRGGK